jgi:hypothetical protein
MIMARRKKYKVGYRIFFEHLDGTIGTEIVLEVIPDTYIDDNNKPIHFDMLVTYKSGEQFSEEIEDYNTLPYSDPRVKALMKELKKQDECADIICEFVNANTDIYSIETIAAALGQVAKQYGYKED